MKLIAVLLLLLSSFCGCMKSKPETIKITIKFEFSEGRSCETYPAADHFYVTVYNSLQKKVAEKKVMCDAADRGLTLFLEEDLYYITVALRDKKELYQSYGSGKLDATLGETEISIKMESYGSGIIFKWDSGDCKKYTLETLKLSLTTLDGEFVPATIWGKKISLEDLSIPCRAEQLEIINIPPETEYNIPPETEYNAKLNGFRNDRASSPRILYEIPKFVLVSGQNSEVKIEDYKSVLVSDMRLSWEFDSKSIDSCESAGVKKVKASLSGKNENLISATDECDDKFSDLYLYDIPKDVYELVLTGFDSNDEAIFETTKDVGEIESGLIGDDIIREEILLKEK